tara:strand:+ start:699 stop:926 length:228 start_codon:yes stop_codon:yes gene_type:complete
MKDENQLPEIPKRIYVGGEPAPDPMSPYWNDWAAVNPTPAAKALGKINLTERLAKSIKGITTGAQPVNNFYQESH